MTTSDRSKSRHHGTKKGSGSKSSDKSRNSHGPKAPSNLTECFFDHLDGEKVEKASFIKSMERQKKHSGSDDLRRPSAILNMSLDVGLLLEIDESEPDVAPTTSSQDPSDTVDCFFDAMQGKRVEKCAKPYNLRQPPALTNIEEDGNSNPEKAPKASSKRRQHSKSKPPRTVESVYGDQHPTVPQLRIPISCNESLRVIEVDF